MASEEFLSHAMSDMDSLRQRLAEVKKDEKKKEGGDGRPYPQARKDKKEPASLATSREARAPEAQILHDLGRFEEALPLALKEMEKYTKEAGAEHPRTGISVHLVAQILRCQGREEEALVYARRAVEIRNAHVVENAATASSLYLLAQILNDLGRGEEALPLARRLVAIRAKGGAEDLQTGTAVLLEARILNDLRRGEEALPLARQAVAIHTKAHGAEHSATASSLGLEALILMDLGRKREAPPLAHRVVAIDTKALANRTGSESAGEDTKALREDSRADDNAIPLPVAKNPPSECPGTDVLPPPRNYLSEVAEWETFSKDLKTAGFHASAGVDLEWLEAQDPDTYDEVMATLNASNFFATGVVFGTLVFGRSRSDQPVCHDSRPSAASDQPPPAVSALATDSAPAGPSGSSQPAAGEASDGHTMVAMSSRQGVAVADPGCGTCVEAKPFVFDSRRCRTTRPPPDFRQGQVDGKKFRFNSTHRPRGAAHDGKGFTACEVRMTCAVHRCEDHICMNVPQLRAVISPDGGEAVSVSGLIVQFAVDELDLVTGRVEEAEEVEMFITPPEPRREMERVFGTHTLAARRVGATATLAPNVTGGGIGGSLGEVTAPATDAVATTSLPHGAWVTWREIENKDIQAYNDAGGACLVIERDHYTSTVRPDRLEHDRLSLGRMSADRPARKVTIHAKTDSRTKAFRLRIFVAVHVHRQPIPGRDSRFCVRTHLQTPVVKYWVGCDYQGQN